MLSKESKIRVLENFYALDYVFFGKPVSQVDMCCPLVKEEYLSVKGALMSVFIEMLKLVDHMPDSIGGSIDGRALKQNARGAAAIARENSQKIVSSQKARTAIKGMLKETLQEDPKVNVSELVEKTIRSKAFGLAVDNLLIARSLKESKAYKNLDEWEGRIVEDSYKILRDNLVESAYMILYDETDDTESVTEWGASPEEQLKDAQREKRQDWILIQRKCMKYRAMDQPEKEKYCLAKQKRKHDEHWKKVFASIKKKK
jgi:hypothetical protein